MKTWTRTDLPRYLAWEEHKGAADQWDIISGRLLGNWATLKLAREFLSGKKLNYGLGFFADSDGLQARWTAGGLIELDFSAKGLFAEKFKRQEYDQDNQTTAEGIAITASGYPVGSFDRAEIDVPTPVIEVIAATNTKPDFTKAGLEISGTPFWLAKTGGKPTGPANPWSISGAGAYTVHYPKGWVMQIQPNDSIGRSLSASTFERLFITTYRAVWRHQVTP